MNFIKIERLLDYTWKACQEETVAYYAHIRNYRLEKFYDIGSWAQCYKTFDGAIYECLFLTSPSSLV